MTMEGTLLKNVEFDKAIKSVNQKNHAGAKDTYIITGGVLTVLSKSK